MWALSSTHSKRSIDQNQDKKYEEKTLDIHSTYQKVILGLYQHNLQSINKEFWCYKNPVNPSCIYLFLINSLRSFTKLRPSLLVHQIFSNLSYQMFKKTLTKSKAREIIYRDFKKLNEQCFNNDLGTQLSSKSIKSYG